MAYTSIQTFHADIIIYSEATAKQLGGKSLNSSLKQDFNHLDQYIYILICSRLKTFVEDNQRRDFLVNPPDNNINPWIPKVNIN